MSNQQLLDMTCKNIWHYFQLARATPCPCQRMYYENLLLQEAEIFLHYARRDSQSVVEQENWAGVGLARQEKVFTPVELAKYNGSNGLPAYVAVNGIVYDLSLEPTWGGGTHFGLYAGRVLTVQFNGCHGNPGILNRLPRVGILQE